MDKFDTWQRMRIYSAINKACFNAKPLRGEFTDMQQAFLEGAATLHDYDPSNMINAVGGRELPKKYLRKYGLTQKRKRKR